MTKVLIQMRIIDPPVQYSVFLSKAWSMASPTSLITAKYRYRVCVALGESPIVFEINLN